MSSVRRKVIKKWNSASSSHLVTSSVRKTYVPKTSFSIGSHEVKLGFDMYDRKIEECKLSFRNKKNEIIVIYFSELNEMDILRTGRPFVSEKLFVKKIIVGKEKMIYLKTRRGYGLEKSASLPLRAFLEIYLKANLFMRKYAKK